MAKKKQPEIYNDDLRALLFFALKPGHEKYQDELNTKDLLVGTQGLIDNGLVKRTSNDTRKGDVNDPTPLVHGNYVYEITPRGLDCYIKIMTAVKKIKY